MRFHWSRSSGVPSAATSRPAPAERTPAGRHFVKLTLPPFCGTSSIQTLPGGTRKVGSKLEGLSAKAAYDVSETLRLRGVVRTRTTVVLSTPWEGRPPPPQG